MAGNNYEAVDTSSTTSKGLFVPPVLAPLNVQAKAFELVAKHDPVTKATQYTYRLIWNIPTDSVPEIGERLKNTPLKLVSPSAENAEMLRSQCDGPCRAMHYAKDLNVLGRCNHLLCAACYGLVVNEDGTPGCSSYRCYWKYNISKKRGLPKTARKKARDLKINGVNDVKEASLAESKTSLTNESKSQSSDTISRFIESKSQISDIRCSPLNTSLKPIPSVLNDISKAGADGELSFPNMTEMILLRVIILENGPYDTVQRAHLAREVPAWQTLAASLDEIVASRGIRTRGKQNPDVYFVTQKKGVRYLQSIRGEKLKKKIYHFPLKQGTLIFVLDAIGQIQKRQRESA
ncbi:unnamed protein product [Caenorhabditis auriculariae]|uniref:RING-type domain-containing protein n=1 Tax=Caenorhabditis auriculariae TaxID=2777116 RepID=A0A8S1HGH8_9PELO|nr:unnamed protein product [Caenorhabditis auriculariae]